MQGHLESVKEELHQTREDLQQSKEKLIEKEDGFRKKLLESDAEIESSRKTIAELQVRVAMIFYQCLIWAPRCTGICLWIFSRRSGLQRQEYFFVRSLARGSLESSIEH